MPPDPAARGWRDRVCILQALKSINNSGGDTVGCISHRKQREKLGCMGVSAKQWEKDLPGDIAPSLAACVRPRW